MIIKLKKAKKKLEIIAIVIIQWINYDNTIKVSNKIEIRLK